MGKYYLVQASVVFSFTAPLSTALIGFKHLSRELKILTVYFIVAGLVEAITFYQSEMKANYFFLQHLYTILAYPLLAYMLTFWQTNNRVRRSILISIPAIAGICLWNMLYNQKFERINDLAQSIVNIFLVFFSAITLLALLRMDSGRIQTNYRFWILTAILFYAAGSLGYFALHNIIESSNLVIAWYFHIGLNILTNFIFAIGFLCQYRRQ